MAFERNIVNKLSVRTQLTVAFGGITLLLITIALLAIASFSQQFDTFENYVNGVRARSEAAHLVREAVGVRAIAARNLVLVSNQRERDIEEKMVREAHAAVAANLNKLKELASDKSVPEEVRRMIERIDGVEQSYAPVALAIVDLALHDKKDEAVARMNQECRPLLAALTAASNDYAKYTSQRSAQLIEEAEANYKAGRNLLLAFSLLATVLALLAGGYIARSLFKALGAEPLELCSAVSKFASGDLTGELAVAPGDSSSVLAAVQRMQLSLSKVVSSVLQDSAAVSTAAAEISSGNSDLSGRTEQQASSLEETASSMEELTSTVKQNADNARQANVLAVSASDIAAKGGEVVSQVVGTMDSISEASRQIVDIIAVIDGIAFQTNILALNAAVEAARAGDQGRGFAVVATEVRSLAQRSATAAKEIKVLIDNSVERVALGSKLASEAGMTMSEVVDSVQRVSDVIAEIMNASREQSAGIEQINQAIIEMDNVTQMNASLVEEAAAAAESLREQADSLVQTVGVFNIRADAYAAEAPRRAPAAKVVKMAAAPERKRSSKVTRLPVLAAQGELAVANWEEF
jgi:methyl-accepting chemotaxis protein-1 (serine sensor receptor)